MIIAFLVLRQIKHLKIAVDVGFVVGITAPKRKTEEFIEKLNEFSSVKKVIGIVSGKGGEPVDLIMVSGFYRHNPSWIRRITLTMGTS